MRSRLVSLLLRMSVQRLLLLFCSSVLMGEPPSPAPAVSLYRITGVVVNSLTGAPIPRSHLSPSLTQQSRGPRRQFPASDGVDSDERGRFSISLPSAGAWHLTARVCLRGLRPT